MKTYQDYLTTRWEPLSPDEVTEADADRLRTEIAHLHAHIAGTYEFYGVPAPRRPPKRYGNMMKFIAKVRGWLR